MLGLLNNLQAIFERVDDESDAVDDGQAGCGANYFVAVGKPNRVPRGQLDDAGREVTDAAREVQQRVLSKRIKRLGRFSNLSRHTL